MSKESKRYFVKRDQVSDDDSQTIPDTVKNVPVKESPVEFPHIFRFITARVLWGILMTCLYSGIVFFVVIQLNVFFPAPQKSTSFSNDLVDAPLSYRSHVLYLESLVVKNRLEEAQHESDYLLIAQNKLAPTKAELESFNKLQDSISARKIVFHTTITEYNHWSDVIKTHPDYRDVLYTLGQKSYMLFDDAQSANYVKQSVDLDPQFEQGKKVLQLLNK